MTHQWQLSGNAESVDWSDLAMAGRAYADNLVGEPAVSKVMHMMADEIERLRSENASNRRISGEFLRRPYCGQNCADAKNDAKNDAIGPQSAAKTTTTKPRNGALSDGPDPDSRVWETQRTPPPRDTPPQGSVPGEGSVPDSRTENEPVAWWLKGSEYDTGCEYEYVSLVKESADAAAKEGGTVTPLYRLPQPTLTDEERIAVEHCCDVIDAKAYGDSATLRRLLERTK